MADTVQTLLRSTIQHGPHNDRVYLMHLETADVPDIIQAMDELARTKGYTKIIARVPSGGGEVFESAGYIREAVVAGYFKNGEDLFFVSRYLSETRQQEVAPEDVARHLALIRNRAAGDRRSWGADSLMVEPCHRADAEEMAGAFRTVFPSYPFPVTDPAYLVPTMKGHTRYFCLRKEGQIAAMAGCEMDMDNLCVEMTDFAVLPRWRGRRFASCLLEAMEREMTKLGMRIAFTIARTLSPAISLTFNDAGYLLGGKLTNNTQISGGIESMWVWYRRLTENNRAQAPGTNIIYS